MIGHFLYRYIVKHDFEKKVTLEGEGRKVYTESKTRTEHRELIKLNANLYIYIYIYSINLTPINGEI